jgi:hypothetical protein
MSDDLQQRLDKAEWVLKNSGFRHCDIPACNCGSWHQVGGYRARFDEINEAVEEAGFSTNGRTLLDAVKDMAEKYNDAQNLIRQLMEQPVIEDTLYGRLARFRSKLPWAYELWVRKHLPGTNC